MSFTSKNSHGYSIIEIMVALTMSLLVFGFIGLIIKSLAAQKSKIELITTLQDEAIILENRIFPLQEIGGGSLRPWHSLWAEDNCGPRLEMPDCEGSDRITTLTTLDEPECSLVSYDSAAKLVTSVEDTPGVCCIKTAHKNLSMTLINGDYVQVGYIDSVDTTACTATLVDHQQGSQFSSLPADDALWAGGSIVFVGVQTYYLDKPTHSLIQYSDRNNDGLSAADERTTLSSNVYDHQIAYGYDNVPSDGIISNSEDDTDEWLFNYGNSEALAQGPFVNTIPSHLRQIEVVATIGLPLQSEASLTITKSLLNGPGVTYTNMYTKPVVIRMNFRNSLIYR